MSLRVLTWNLMHGRALPPAGHDLFDEFAAALSDWAWDAALLQEVPPWWPALLGERLRAEWRLVLTSRNAGLAARQAIAIRWPDVIKSNGGGANAILVRGHAIAEHRTLRLCRLPERRWLQAVRLAAARDAGGPGAGGRGAGGRGAGGPGAGGRGVWLGNLHATGGNAAAGTREAQLAASTMLAWAGAASAVLGGDFNLRSVSLEEWIRVGGSEVDLVFARALTAVSEPEVLEHGRLSDHAPVAVSVGSVMGKR